MGEVNGASAGVAQPASSQAGWAPCTFGQERLWFIDQLVGGESAYNEALGVRFRGPVDADALQRSLDELIRRHAALRTTLGIRDGEPVQCVADSVTVPLRRVDVADEDELSVLTAELASEPFDLGALPLLRAMLVRVARAQHVLQLVLHHTICDGLSHVVILRELGQLYRALSAGIEPDLPDVRAQYPDFAREQRTRLQGAALEELIAPWHERLADIPAALEVPLDHPRPALQSYRGATQRVRIDSTVTRALREFCRAQRATPFTVLLSVFEVLLHRYSGQDRIVLGSGAGGRDRRELDDAVGMFVNTIVLRGDLSGDPSFRELLTRIRRMVLDATMHQQAPFERLVASLKLEPDLSRHPIFQVFFSARPHATIGLPGAEPYHAETGGARSDLTVFVEEISGEFELIWEFNTDLFEPDTIARMQRHYVRLLRSALEDAETSISRLRMLEHEERRALLAQWSIEGDYPVFCLHERFEGQVAAAPEAPAASFEDVTLTYAELNGRANRLAHRLRELGIGRESFVALYLERSLELVVAIIAVLKAGGAYVPLDPQYPTGRVAFVLSDTGAPVVLSQTSLLERLPDTDAQVLCLDEERLDAYSDANLTALSTPENLAYVIYTSGSTGQPKGVQVEHRHVARLFTGTDHWYGFGPRDRWVLAHSYAFDVSVWELWGALAHGGSITVPPFWLTRSPEAFAELVAARGITILSATPSLFSAIQDELLARAERLALRAVVFAGEALHPPSLRPWFERFGDEGAAMVNMYGITETTVHTTYRVVRAADSERDTSPIGVPIPDLSLYLLDPTGEPVARGVTGELYVGGAGVTRGYLNRPELNAQRFLDNPFAPGRMYRSGDLARQLPDGELGFLGRMDDQVKIRGFRIELGEVQAVLDDHPGVSECAVLAVKLGPDDVRLAAFVVPIGSASDLRQSLRAHLEERLPAYMVPASITFLAGLPLTTNGKLDRRALPSPEWEGQREVAFAPPRTETEERIAKVWRDVLGVEQVGVDDNFFQLGGHSLLAARIVARIREAEQISLSVRTLFEQPTLSAFARSVEAATPVVARERTPAPVDASPTYPLSFNQEQLLFFDQLSSDSVAYNSAFALRVQGGLDHARLREALAVVHHRHAVLRTALIFDEDTARQVVLDPATPELPLIEAGGLTESELDTLLRAHARRPFDLATESPLRTTLFRLREREHVLLFQTHHVAFDARALEVLYAELGELYAASGAGRSPVLPQLPCQYGDFAAWQRQYFRGDVLAAKLDFWRGRLAGAPTMLALPTDHPRPPMQTFAGATMIQQLEPALAEGVRERAASENVTPYMLLLAAFTTLLYRRSGQTDILVGGPMTNREQPQFADLIGFFANTVVVRVKLGGNPAFAQLVSDIRESVLESLDHQDIPIGLVVGAVSPARDPSANPLFQVNFRVRIGEGPALELAGARTSPIALDTGIARFDLSLELHLLEDGIEAEWGWNTDLFERATILAMAADFERLLAQALAEPQTRLLSLEVGAEAGAIPGAGGIRSLRRSRRP